ncbi:SAM hydrolase/SAM-dependent halogenase family protein [Dehalogenimonas etheniformans]|uniref:S-adenosyl-l-methionine hydroxide adenosyltransferase n=1 Tax=Dehalogenimonas etheniformans TaxID=1536648 RepID=A0A2P5P6T3_9CHLR|nr:SAM-dependent chlorinase/fluorinase [Dehalogenimonas etheniformans]PPD58004.1 S-adenosyl-l-methionine hydroxide adenosyltransferase [Dehalogenimonas etheniformans]QNT75353.1 SAM-dependent chlorinase/fluorinase [Dehalogenimonas etheniformans]
MSGIITLTTDFGDTSGYAAALKGVILGIAPDVQIVDISHQIAPQNIFEAAFLLSTVYRCFPHYTVHLVVVDPGVGTDRKIIALKTSEGKFIGPDNGVLSYAVKNYVRDAAITSSSLLQGELSNGAKAVTVTNSPHFRHPVSDTFHGRDIMAPVAAMLSKGFELTAFGEPLERLTMLDLPQAVKEPGGTVIGHIILIDRFGNMITDVRESDLPQGGELRLELGKKVVSGLKKTYSEGIGLMALIGSSGYLEIAVNGGSAAAVTNLKVGDVVKVFSKQSSRISCL